VTEWAAPEKLPPKHHQRIIEQLAASINDPAQKLRFINQAFQQYATIPTVYKAYGPLAEVALWNMLWELIEQSFPESKENAQIMVLQKDIPVPSPFLWRLYAHRTITALCVFLLLVLGPAAGVSTLICAVVNQPPEIRSADQVRPSPQNPSPSVPEPVSSEPHVFSESQPKLEGRVIVTEYEQIVTGSAKQPPEQPVCAFSDYLNSPIWMVEKNETSELYSNGLRIITVYAVKNIPRCYCRFARNEIPQPSALSTSDEIAGILYHASEGDMVAFEPEKNQSIIEYTERLLSYIPREKCYHYFIDRFGRVYRIVREDQAAFHAGNSVWADEEHVYLNLNHAFLGVCFEGKDFEQLSANDKKFEGKQLAQLVRMSSSSINDAQLRSGKELTDYLRLKYAIPQYNCVPHGLTSVNPHKMLIGYHLDLSHSFPFAAFRLQNKYEISLPSITDFGFSYDDYFVNVFRGHLWPGIHLSEKVVAEGAKEARVPMSVYREQLQKRYVRLYALEKKIRREQCNADTLIVSSSQ